MLGLPIGSPTKFANRRNRARTSSSWAWSARMCSSQLSQREACWPSGPRSPTGGSRSRTGIAGGIQVNRAPWSRNLDLIGCSTEGAVLLADAAQHPSMKTPPIRVPGFLQTILMKRLQKRPINPAAFDDAAYTARLQRAFDIYSKANAARWQRSFLPITLGTFPRWRGCVPRSLPILQNI
jgi:hypothetical protein